MKEKTMIYEWLCDIVTTLETLTEQVKGLANTIDLDEESQGWMEGTYEVEISEDGDTAFDVIGK